MLLCLLSYNWLFFKVIQKGKVCNVALGVGWGEVKNTKLINIGSFRFHIHHKLKI